MLLNATTLRMSAEMWAYGANNAFPDFDFELPPDHAKSAFTGPLDMKKPLSDPTYSPLYGIDLLSRLKLHRCDIHISQYMYRGPILSTESSHGDIPVRVWSLSYIAHCAFSIHPIKVRADYVQYPGMGHILGASFLPECRDMFADVKGQIRDHDGSGCMAVK